MNTIDPRTPVLVGCGQLVQRVEDPRDGLEPLDMMLGALELAAEDAGNRDLLGAADSIRVLHGLWDYSNPAAILAERLGVGSAQTALGMISGTTVQKLISDAAVQIVRGRRDVVLVTGAEAEHSKRRAKRAGHELVRTQQSDSRPDLTVGYTGPIWPRPERELGLMLPTQWFALAESALRHRSERSPDAHRVFLSELWAGFNAVAIGNPDAWVRKALSPEQIRTPTSDNRMTTWPYTKYLCANMVVDQAAAILVCSLEAARRFGVPEHKLVFPLVATDCGGAPGLSERLELDREPAMQIAGSRALELAGAEVDAISYLDLYSCFPSAVQLCASALDIPLDRPLTVTGGLSFAGGPFNSYVLHSTSAMMQRLRGDPGSLGLVSSVGGCLNTHAFSLYASVPSPRGFVHEELSERIAELPQRDFVPEHDGEAIIESYAPDYDGLTPRRAVIALRLEGGARTWAVSEDAGLLATMAHEELCGRRARIRERKLLDVL